MQIQTLTMFEYKMISFLWLDIPKARRLEICLCAGIIHALKMSSYYLLSFCKFVSLSIKGGSLAPFSFCVYSVKLCLQIGQK